MKKVLACLLVLTMVLGSFSVAFAGSYTDVADNASYAQAVEVLTSLGLVKGDGDGTYRPADAVKRSEMAKLIVVALGYGEFAAAQKATKFSDVPASHWASGYISFASDLGIIEGVGAGKFNPDVTVSFDEAITMLVRALGYADDKLPGSWPTDMVVKAMDLGIITKTQVGSNGADRGSVAEMLYKTLGKEEVTFSAVLGQYVEGETLLAGLGYTPADAALIDETTTDALLLKHVGEFGVVYTDKAGKAVAFVPSSVELSGTVKSVSGKTVFTVGTTNYEFKSADVLTLGSGVNADWVALTNGVAGEGGSAVLSVGEVRVLDVKLEAGKIAQVYSVGAWVSPTTVAVTKAEAANIVKTDLASAATINGVNLPLKDKAVDTSKVVLNGVSALSEIKEGSVVTYYVAGSTITRMDVSNAKVVGQISKVAGSKYTINGVEYTVNGLSGAGIALGAKGTWSLDAAGKLFAYTAVDTTITSVNYAVVTEAAKEETAAVAGGVYGGAAAYKPGQVQLLLADGTQAIYNINKDAYNDVFANLSTVDAVVKYTLNANNEIVDIDTVSPVSGTFALTAYGTLDGKLVASNVVVLAKTKGEFATDLATDKYALSSIAALKSSITAKYVADANNNVILVVVDEDDIKGAATSTTYAVFTGAASNILVGDKYAQEITAIVNGVAGTYQTEAAASAVSLLTSVSTEKLYSVTLKDGKITAVTEAEDLTGTAKVDTVVGSFTKVAGVSGDLVNLNASSPDYKNVAGATVYVATLDANGKFVSWTVGSMANVVKDASVVLYKDGKLATGAYANIIFVLPAATKTAPTAAPVVEAL